jgi:hypothetical protein
MWPSPRYENRAFDPSAKTKSQALLLSRKPPFAFHLCLNRQDRSRSRLFCFLGLPQGVEPFHVLADRNGLPLDICHSLRTFFDGQTLPIGARDAFGGRFS